MKKQAFILSIFAAIIFSCSNDLAFQDDLGLTNQDLASLKATDLPIENGENQRKMPTNFQSNSITGTFILGPGEGCEQVTLMAMGEGNVSHLGLSTIDERWCWPGSGPELGTRFATFTAANGDELWGIPTAIEWALDGLSYVQELDIVGGTGRFENASGAYTEYNEITFDSQFTGTFDLKIEGYLSK